MKQIIQFLDDFMEAEIQVMQKFLRPNLEEYNSAVDIISDFTVNELNESFGAKMRRLKRPEYYERVKNYTPPTKRLIFRIDENHLGEEILYKCFLSKVGPSNYRSYFSLFIIGVKAGKLRILASYSFSNKGMGGGKKYYFHAGVNRFNVKFNEYQIFDDKTLGAPMNINRILEPADDRESIEEYEKEF